MGMLVKGVWLDNDNDSRFVNGKFDHKPSRFRQLITLDGSSGFKAEANRYSIYAGFGCPWSHRITIMRALKGLQESIGVIFLLHGKEGMMISETEPHSLPGTDKEIHYLHEIYSCSDSDYTGRVSVPVLWDSQQQKIVSNESADIMRMLNAEFEEYTTIGTDYYPEDLRVDIDSLNDELYDSVMNGIFKASFSTDKPTIMAAKEKLFSALENLESHLSQQRYLFGGRNTEADWRLFVTLIRYEFSNYYSLGDDAKDLREYPNLWNYMLDLYQTPGVEEVTFMDAIKKGPGQLAEEEYSKRPFPDLWTTHNRARFSQ